MNKCNITRTHVDADIKVYYQVTWIESREIKYECSVNHKQDKLMPLDISCGFNCSLPRNISINRNTCTLNQGLRTGALDLFIINMNMTRWWNIIAGTISFHKKSNHNFEQIDIKLGTWMLFIYSFALDTRNLHHMYQYQVVVDVTRKEVLEGICIHNIMGDLCSQ